MSNPATIPAYLEAAQGALSLDDVPVSVIRDCPGFICQRIIAMIVNIGCAIAEQGVATPEDIDKAVVFGLGYPHGPLTFGDIMGPKRILQILQNLQNLTGDPRYRPSLWLRRRALLGLSLREVGS